MPRDIYNPPTKTCPVCGKSFICKEPNKWTYRKYGDSKRNYFCSWKCMRKWEEERKKK